MCQCVSKWCHLIRQSMSARSRASGAIVRLARVPPLCTLTLLMPVILVWCSGLCQQMDR